MNVELFEVKILALVLGVGKNGDEVVLRCAPARLDERCKDLEQSHRGRRVGFLCRFAQHEFRVGVGCNRIGENERLLPLLFGQAQDSPHGSNRKSLGR